MHDSKFGNCMTSESPLPIFVLASSSAGKDIVFLIQRLFFLKVTLLRV